MQVLGWKRQPKRMFKLLFAAMVSLPCLQPFARQVDALVQPRTATRLSQAPLPDAGFKWSHPSSSSTKPTSSRHKARIKYCLCTDFCKCQRRMVLLVWLVDLFFFFLLPDPKVFFLIFIFISYLWLYQW